MLSPFFLLFLSQLALGVYGSKSERRIKRLLIMLELVHQSFIGSFFVDGIRVVSSTEIYNI